MEYNGRQITWLSITVVLNMEKNRLFFFCQINPFHSNSIIVSLFRFSKLNIIIKYVFIESILLYLYQYINHLKLYDKRDYSTTSTKEDTAGFLHHSLQTKPTPVKVEIKTKEVRKDSIIYRDRVRVEKVPIMVKKPLSWWQKTQQAGFWVLLFLVAVIAAAKNYTKIIAVILKLLTKF